MPNFKYKAIRIKQTNSSDWLVLFAASAIEIDMWAGIPQKKEIGGQETTGFQREENPKRIKEIGEFYRNEKNIIQNPLLCALRKHSIANQIVVHFEIYADENKSNDIVQHGILSIITESLENLTLLELLKRVKEDLEFRVPILLNKKVPEKLIRELKQRAELQPDEQDYLETSSDNEDQIIDTSDEEENSEVTFTDESHIFDFWEEVTGRISVIEEISSTFTQSEFLGYSKDAMISFLRPVVVVDGQHRLRAAIRSAKQLAREESYKEDIEKAIIEDGIAPEEAEKNAEIKAARKLPISLLMNTDPAEHVFQFVVVNQKATPIKPALLGTIVSTSLSNEELERVSQRLEKAGIELEESRAVTYLARHQYSPFYGLVERGLASDRKDYLKWNVLSSLVKIFRDLSGGMIFGDKNDYANIWKRSYFEQSQIVAQWESKGYQSPFDYWHQLDGPWRDVFVSFWTVVRDKLADKENEQAWHYWGAPKQSNIFNKTSLTILASDFFQRLCERRIGIDSTQYIPLLVNEWLDGVNSGYFNRDWKLEGIKKDIPGIRKQWAKQWLEYRKNPQRLPSANLYRVPIF
ncbi:MULTISPECIES: hypothetical protein [unclassified Nostoc]|uniref:hypothetical protein n=1 Tax=unclassified Nostoc TaxID=2593658 RepID=UPI002AD2E277|nr:hypothetical protein [Nostoc sp. DedQUE03]MDZ7975863.1 hypothetical protein [Nostoc sp. DedQUE03]MDZ8048397.1 hypothetical protein [Nostoc sp. DedQUE02]